MTTTVNASTSAGLIMTPDTSGILQLQTANTTAVTIDGSQNVGIGTSSPQAKFDVSSLSRWRVDLSGTTAIAYVTNSAINAYYDWRLDALSHQFYTNGSEKMRIDSSGNLLVGTTSITSGWKFTVNGSQYNSGSISSTSGDPNFGAGGARAFMDFNGITARIGTVQGGTGTSYPTAFYVGGGEVSRFDTSGNLLVGTTSNSLGGPRLVVQNSGASANGAHFYFTSTEDRGNVLIQHARASGATSAAMIQFFNASSSNVGAINSTGSATAYVTSSDYRLKENIAPMTGALDKISELKPVTYTWKDGGYASQGFIAHELQEVVPECVVGEKDAVDADGNPVYQGIDTSFLVATLTAAIQEQQAIIQQLTARIETLEAK